MINCDNIFLLKLMDRNRLMLHISALTLSAINSKRLILLTIRSNRESAVYVSSDKERKCQYHSSLKYSVNQTTDIHVNIDITGSRFSGTTIQNSR